MVEPPPHTLTNEGKQIRQVKHLLVSVWRPGYSFSTVAPKVPFRGKSPPSSHIVGEIGSLRASPKVSVFALIAFGAPLVRLIVWELMV